MESRTALPPEAGGEKVEVTGNGAPPCRRLQSEPRTALAGGVGQTAAVLHVDELPRVLDEPHDVELAMASFWRSPAPSSHRQNFAVPVFGPLVVFGEVFEALGVSMRIFMVSQPTPCARITRIQSENIFWNASVPGASFRQPDEIFQQLQPDLLAFLRVKLRGIHIIAPTDEAKLPP